MTCAGFARPLPQATTARAVCDRLPRAALIGNPDRPIRAIGALSTHESGVLAFCDAARAAEHLAHTPAAVVIVPNALATMPRAEQTFVAVDDVRSAFIDIVEALLPHSGRPVDPVPGIDAEAVIGEGAAISPLACVGPRVRISAGTGGAVSFRILQACVSATASTWAHTPASVAACFRTRRSPPTRSSAASST